MQSKQSTFIKPNSSQQSLEIDAKTYESGKNLISKYLNPILMTIITLWLAFGIIWGLKHKNTQTAQNFAAPIAQAPIEETSAPKAPEITPIAEETIYNSQNLSIGTNGNISIGVFGDSMGDGVWAGLYRELGGTPGVSLYKFSKQATGLTNYDYFDTAEEAKKSIAKKNIQVAIMVIGTNDARGINGRGKAVFYGSPKWESAYQNRIQEMVSIFNENNIAIYWVGLPKMRDETIDKSARLLGGYFAKNAKTNNYSFVSTLKETSNEKGEYIDRLQLPNEPTPKVLRRSDGVHFEMEGYRIMALPIIDIINRDLAQTNHKLEPKSRRAQ